MQNKNLDTIKSSKLKYSAQAILILENLNTDFPFEQFEKWVEEKHFIVGGGYVVEFLAERKKLIDNEVKNLANIKDV